MIPDQELYDKLSYDLWEFVKSTREEEFKLLPDCLIGVFFSLYSSSDIALKVLKNLVDSMLARQESGCEEEK